MANRAAAEKAILKHIGNLDSGTRNQEIYKALFARLSDKDFEEWMTALEQGDEYLAFFMPPGQDEVLSTERAKAVGEQLGVKFFQRIRMTDPSTGEVFTTPIEYLILHFAVRRQNQHLIKKQSFAEHDRSIDHLTGQVTGDSKGGKVSLPELLQLEGKGFENAILELIKARGGDAEAATAMYESVRETGGFSMEALRALDSKPTATKVLSALLLSAHLDNTIGT